MIEENWTRYHDELTGWSRYLQCEFQKDYMMSEKGLEAFLRSQDTHFIYPPEKDWFAAFRATPFEKVKVVILGQDPYPKAGQAHGLSFSVPRGVKPPNSLRNIYKELTADIGFVKPEHGCLNEWADQGVLLMNTVLTVAASNANSHKSQGWECFTSQALKALEEHGDHLVFLAWGDSAKKTLAHAGITHEKYGRNAVGKHLLLCSSHPSGLSAYRTDTPFLDSKTKSGCRHFSIANEYLDQHSRGSIHWQLGL